MTNLPSVFLGLNTLERVYGIFQRKTGQFAAACQKGCSHCCTCNVTLTSLEAAFIFARLDQAGIEALEKRISAAKDGPRFRPALTTNGFAAACMSQDKVPEEENDPSWGPCPLLENGMCSIYPVRPLGCRNMVSKSSCGKTGYADMPPMALTLNNLFLQYVEGMDTCGFSGNLTDMLDLYITAGAAVGPGGSAPLYLSFEKLQDFDKKGVFIGNRPVPAWMIPPEHRDVAVPVLKELNTAG
ncbi:MAG TPA: hypothetical protein DHV36_12145 [Desulfobacteraceae bacterium]|nr:hypothetical protein [Desulfobacteraceae bacterium]